MGSKGGVIAVGALLATTAILIVVFARSVPDPIGVGQDAPPFTLAPPDGGPSVSLADLRGSVVLINFWATWCKPCEDEMPSMERLYQRLAGESFELVAISVDEDSAPVAEFRDRMALTFPILMDGDRSVANAYQSYRFPETYLIDARGQILGRFIGPRDWDSEVYIERIRRALGASPEAAEAS